MTKGRELVEPLAAPPEYETAEPVLYEVVDGVAWITMNRPGFNNAQNGQMTYALDDCFKRALEDDKQRNNSGTKPASARVRSQPVTSDGPRGR